MLAPVHGHDPFPLLGTLVHPAAVLLWHAPGDAPVMARLVRAIKELVLRCEGLALGRRMVCGQYRGGAVAHGGWHTRHRRARRDDGDSCCSREDQAPQGQLADIHRNGLPSLLFSGNRRQAGVPAVLLGVMRPEDLLAALTITLPHAWARDGSPTSGSWPILRACLSAASGHPIANSTARLRS
jgi:hypothetical protein